MAGALQFCLIIRPEALHAASGRKASSGTRTAMSSRVDSTRRKVASKRASSNSAWLLATERALGPHILIGRPQHVGEQNESQRPPGKSGQSTDGTHSGHPAWGIVSTRQRFSLEFQDILLSRGRIAIRHRKRQGISLSIHKNDSLRRWVLYSGNWRTVSLSISQSPRSISSGKRESPSKERSIRVR